jgi:hypothetical protein
MLAAVLLAPNASADVASDAGAAKEALAGRYFGTLPSDTPGTCSSLDALLTLNVDGSYVLQFYCQDELVSWTVRRTWTVTWNGTCVDLDPQDHAQPRREFAIHDEGLLVLTTGSCMEPVEDPRGRTLHRAVEDARTD